MSKRIILAVALIFISSFLPAAAQKAAPEDTADGEVFNRDVLITKAVKLSKQPYQAPADDVPQELKDLTYDQHRDIRFVRENGPWYGKRLLFEVQFFHLGSLFQVSVPINEVIDGKAKPIDYSPAFFNYGKNDLKITDNHLGYAGFRLHNPLNSPTYYDELVSFLGASYFRALGKQQKYGLSARGLAIDTAVQTGEEFPIFREFWIQRPKRGDKSVTVYALLDSPSITGAYTFVITPGKQTVMDVDTVLIPRKAINKIGIAPLTSMFLFGENTKNRFDDHRPEVHDSDGLLIWNGKDEVLWRPLDNSKYLRISSFMDENPKGFGLMQRDRDPAHYLDFEADYEQRPSAWVEPSGNWGKGTIQLVEIPSQQEIHDNIVAFWVPEKPVEPGVPLQYHYKLYWSKRIPFDTGKARITSTYTGIGGVSGMLETNKRKFVVDFALPGKRKDIRREIKEGKIIPEVSTSEGRIAGTFLAYNPVTGGGTVYADFEPNNKTAELRIVLKKDGKAISEVWSYQWLP